MTEQAVDRIARAVRNGHATPAHRDAVALLGLGCIVAAVALWQPVIGLAALGVALIVVAFLTAPEVKAPDGS